MIDAASILDQFAARHTDRRGAGGNGTVTYLDGLLSESVSYLTGCARDARVMLTRREALIAVVHEVCLTKMRLCAPRKVISGSPRSHYPSLPAMTRDAVSDMERAGLFEAFRDRCASLATRLAEPDQAEAAIRELSSGARVIDRHVG